ncbi:hypothetical protein ANCCAN_04074 [Ancylostoma caninum]|uniref:CHK kinase-like domain-containing protein n=1 Tax=Ancylostoma caninum TaxID=29170 RepID=A0A368GZN1_ANCCA|nr:hypothetical protein ANCCAN_04074 [Ancylostoma caninum]
MSEILIDGFTLTNSWLQDQIEREHGCRPRVLKVEPLGPDAVGYMSVIRRVHLEWYSDRSELPKSVIVKIPCTTAAGDASESADATMKDLDTYSLGRISHTLETKFYRFLQNEKQKSLLAPMIYVAEGYDSEQPVIVMEDYRNCSVMDVVDGFSEKQLFAVFEQIANLQALSIRNKHWITILKDDEKCMRKQLVSIASSQTRSMSQKLLEDMPEQFSCLKTFLANTIDKDPEWINVILDQYDSGVLWRDENTLAGIVDWQFVHRASPVEDILCVLALSTSTANRRKLLHPLLDHYYEKMKEQLGADMPFSREYLDDELKFVAPWCCMWAVGDAALFINSNMVIRNGEVCSERVDEIVQRCVSFVEDVITLCGW